MNARKTCSCILVIVGLLAMLLGAIDPLEGSFIILPGSGMVGPALLTQPRTTLPGTFQSRFMLGIRSRNAGRAFRVEVE